VHVVHVDRAALRATRDGEELTVAFKERRTANHGLFIVHD
jgi:hypothetical protein